ncbi:MAG TPA: hypothetical protein VH255_10005 [Verrucomicrobiae bacterium]|nr:hypothetical protein [Verrucomicrobiae bacterium]
MKINKQFVLAGITALVTSAFIVGCSKESVDAAYDKTTNVMENAKDATTNAAMHAWDATKTGAKAAGDAITNAAGEVKEGVTNAWEKMTSTNQ